MFHFPGFALPCLCIQQGVLDRSPVGCPIRGSRDHGLLAAPSGFSQLSTPFIASDRQGIHHTLFVACQISKALRDVLSAFHFNLCSGELSLRSTVRCAAFQRRNVLIKTLLYPSCFRALDTSSSQPLLPGTRIELESSVSLSKTGDPVGSLPCRHRFSV
jgi:hypothetical protein